MIDENDTPNRRYVIRRNGSKCSVLTDILTGDEFHTLDELAELVNKYERICSSQRKALSILYKDPSEKEPKK